MAQTINALTDVLVCDTVTLLHLIKIILDQALPVLT